mmetsp:Transcript_7942/g.17426  ORF Transcript_7942/g.17426 Transcript_7942/m.17426 type:complete len:348 (-) Transcript_7942:223-1266(-)
MREHHRRNVCILELCLGRSTEEPIGEPAASGDRDGRQLIARGGAVTKTVQPLDAGVLLRIDDHATLVVELHACCLQPNAFGHRMPADGHQHDVEVSERLPRRELGCELSIGLLAHGRHLCLCFESDTRSRDFLIEHLLDHRVESVAHHSLSTARERDCCAQRLEDASELDCNVPSANDERLLRLLHQVEEAVTRDAVLGARNRWHCRLATHSNEHVVRRQRPPVHLHSMRPREARNTLDTLDGGLIQVRLVDAIEPLDVCIALFNELAPVKLRMPAKLNLIPRCGLCHLKVRRRRVHELFWDAPNIDASAAVASAIPHAILVPGGPTFNEGHLLPIHRCAPGARDSP